MGGSGGGGYFSGDPRKALREIKEAESQTESQEFAAGANQALGSLLSDFNNRNVEAINRHLEDIKQALDEELDDGTIDLRFGGSVSKHTFVDGLSDVDSLVMLDNCDLADGSPSEAKEYLARRLREEFPGQRIETGRLAVTIHFEDAEIQLLPAVSCKGAVKIAESGRDRWAAVRPKEFATALSEVNERVGGKVVPVIKLAKAVLATLPEKQQLSGYHTESLAVDIFRGYKGPQTHKDMVKHFFEGASKRVEKPIADVTGQSTHVDEYLGKAGSLERRIVSDSLARIARRMSNADAAASVDQWTALFES